MADIIINEVSQNYTYNIGTNSFAAVALPITACWGPCFGNSEALGYDGDDEQLENCSFEKFASTEDGLRAFVSTYRGPAENYRLAGDYSYQMAMTLMNAGYDVNCIRLCPGAVAGGEFVTEDGAGITVNAKYPGSFGNKLKIKLTKKATKQYWSLVVYPIESTGKTGTALENLMFTLDINNSSDSINYISEVESNFVTLTVNGSLNDETVFTEDTITLEGGSDREEDTDVASMIEDAVKQAEFRYIDKCGYNEADCVYIDLLKGRNEDNTDIATASILKYKEWLYSKTWVVLELLTDRLTYSPQRIILPGWDDQDMNAVGVASEEYVLPYDERFTYISPLHVRLMETAYYSRCATALLDIPRSLMRKYVWDEDSDNLGYAQMLSEFDVSANDDINAELYCTHSALFAPWRKFTYTGTSKQNIAPPAFLALMIQRAMILNQSIQYEWCLPTNRVHNLNIGKADYAVPKKLLDDWQNIEGVGVNVVTEIGDLGITLWGNSTLYDTPPATYQALANLSTRYLVNAVENIAFICGLSITYQYNNDQAYNKFYAGVTPTLDMMKNVGAIVDYRVQMRADIDGLDQVNANSVIGTIYLTVNGVINNITVDLICLPPNVDLDYFTAL